MSNQQQPIDETTRQIPHEEPLKHANRYLSQKDLPDEIATMNGSDTSGELPLNLYTVEIRSNDHSPRHIHLIKKGDYDLTFSIDTGDFLEETWAKKQYNVSALTERVKAWFNKPSSFKESFNLTNQQICMIQWNVYHPSDE